ncbi:MAG: biotin transporter BioY [Spirochaetota bacterium]
MVLTSLFAALTAVGAYIAVPIGPVPITLQTLFITLAGLLGGRKIGLSAAAIYLLAGIAGLPIFSGGTGGFAHLVGPTGGFLIGVLLCAWIAGLFGDLAREAKSQRFWQPLLLFAGALAGGASVYLTGVPWLKISLDLSWSQAFAMGVLPFLIGDLLKSVAAAGLARIFISQVQDLLAQEQDT